MHNAESGGPDGPEPEAVNRLHLVHLVDDLRGQAPSDSERPHPILASTRPNPADHLNPLL